MGVREESWGLPGRAGAHLSVILGITWKVEAGGIHGYPQLSLGPAWAM